MKAKSVKAVLVREHLVNPKVEVPDEIMELARKSRIVLGYKLMHGLVTKPKSLREVLRELDIQPYSAKSVENYKAERVEKLAAKLRKHGMRAVWQRSAIPAYHQPIPEFVLHKAIQLKEALPSVVLDVEYLTRQEIDPDPFLVASFGNERYYIEVWDEPKFENKVLSSIHSGLEDNVGGKLPKYDKYDDDSSEESDVDDEG